MRLGATAVFGSIEEAAEFARSVTNGQGADSTCGATPGRSSLRSSTNSFRKSVRARPAGRWAGPGRRIAGGTGRASAGLGDPARRGRLPVFAAHHVPATRRTRRVTPSAPPTVNLWPGSISRLGARFGWVQSHSARSAGCSQISASVASPTSKAAPTWSSCACVSSIATSRWSPMAARIAAASWGASISTHSSSFPINQTLLSACQQPPSSENVPEVTMWSMPTRPPWPGSSKNSPRLSQHHDRTQDVATTHRVKGCFDVF